jgi:phage terminase small subunit
MPILPNPRWEKYAQCVASGMTPGRAAASAGYAKSGNNQGRLKTIPEVARRIEEVRIQLYEATIKKSAVEKSHVIQSIIETREAAKAAMQYGAALKADELLGKTIGMFIERREIGRAGEFEGLSDKREIVEAIIARIEHSPEGSDVGSVAGGEGESGEEPDIVHQTGVDDG